MSKDSLEQAIAWAYHRLENLSARASHIGEQTASLELLQEAIAEIAISLEELHVLAEELTAQNHELDATRQLVEAERQSYQDLFNFAPDGYLVTDLTGVIQEANYAAAELLNVRQSYLIGKPLAVFIHQTELPKFCACIGKLQEQQEQKSTEEFRIFHNHGKTDFPAEMTVALIAGNSEPKKLGLRWLFRDISDRLQAQQKIREQAALLDVTTDAILVRDLENQILYWNQGAENIYGWRATEVMGQNAWELLSPEASPQLAVALPTVSEHGTWFGELRKVTRNNRPIIVNSRWTLMYDATGQPKSIMTVDTDITEKKQLERQLQRSQQLESLGTLVSAIAHDLNDILAPMMTVAQLLPLKHPQLSESSLQMLKLLETNTQRGTNLVQQIQSFTSNLTRTTATVSVSHLMKEIKRTSKHIFPKSIELDINIPSDTDSVLGEQAQLHEVLINLLINATNAMPQGGKVQISTDKALIDQNFTETHAGTKVGNYVVITVTCMGIGLTPENFNQNFQPFLTTKQQGKGTALGLALDNINNYSGFVKVSSQTAVERKFQVYLPSSESSTPPSVNQLKLPIGNGELILVVDDEVAITQITKTTLEIHNYRVLTADSGIEALTLYTQHQQDIKLVLMDMMMSSISGGCTIKTLQIINPQVKIVAMSGLASAQALAQGTVTGIQGFLAKPFTADELLNCIENVLVAEIHH